MRMRAFVAGGERASAAVFAAAPLIALVALYTTSSYVRLPLEGHWDSALLTGSSALLLVGPVAASVAAWDVGRLRRGGVLNAPVVRGRLVVVGRAVVPALALGVVGLTVAWALTVPGVVGAPGPRHALLVATPLVVLVGAVSVGALAGATLPPWLASAACLVGGYIWFVYPPALEPLWLRHLTGYESGCCGSWTQVTLGGAVAPGVLAAGATAAVAVLVRRGSSWTGTGRRGPIRLLAAACWAVAAAAAAAMVVPLGPTPTEPRTTPTACRDGQRVRVCVWPEHVPQLPALTQATDDVHAALEKAGLTVPTVASESTADRTAWVFGVSASTEAADWTEQAVAIGLLPSWPEDCILPSPLAIDLDAAGNWVLATIGHPPDDASTVPAGSVTEQAAWVERTFARVQGACEPAGDRT